MKGWFHAEVVRSVIKKNKKGIAPSLEAHFIDRLLLA